MSLLVKIYVARTNCFKFLREGNLKYFSPSLAVQILLARPQKKNSEAKRLSLFSLSVESALKGFNCIFWEKKNTLDGYFLCNDMSI